MAACYFHADRPGVGICMRCRVVICAACCTRLDGVNHCHACLAALGRRSEAPRATRGAAALTAALLAGLGWLFLLGIFWLTRGVLAP